MGIYVGAGGVKTVNSLYVGAGGVKTVTAVYVGAGGTYQVWPDEFLLYTPSDNSYWSVYSRTIGSVTYNMGSIESYGLQFSGSSVPEVSGTYASDIMTYPFYRSFGTDRSHWPDTLDDYEAIHIDYNIGNPSAGTTSNYSRYVGFVFYASTDGSLNASRQYGGGTTFVGRDPTFPMEVIYTLTDNQKSRYRNNISTMYDMYFRAGGYDSVTDHNDDDDEYNYNRGYITKIWIE